MSSEDPLYEAGSAIPNEPSPTEHIYVQVRNEDENGEYQKQFREIEKDGTAFLGLKTLPDEDDVETVQLGEDTYRQLREAAANATGGEYNACATWKTQWGRPPGECVVYLGERGNMESEGVGNPGKFRPDVRGDSYVARSVFPDDLEGEYKETEIVRDGMDDVLSILQENGVEVMERP